MPSATCSARTPTSASTAPAPSTPTGTRSARNAARPAIATARPFGNHRVVRLVRAHGVIAVLSLLACSKTALVGKAAGSGPDSSAPVDVPHGMDANADGDAGPQPDTSSPVDA